MNNFFKIAAGILAGGAMVYAADNVVMQNGGLTQKSAQNLAAPLRATDNGDGSWTLAVNTIASSILVTPTITTATGNGTIPSGSRSATFIFSNDFAGTVLGAAFSGANDDFLRIIPPGGSMLTTVPYTVTAGNVRIIDVR